MLVNWTLENFKSVGELTLSLSPITVFVGANSSGKSSIIQSILLIKQTLQYATPDQPIALNGPLLKLGNFNDIKNVSSGKEGFRVGWKYDARPLLSTLPSLTATSDLPPSRSTLAHALASEIECETIFDINTDKPVTELSLLQPSLKSCKINVILETPDGSPQSAELAVSRAKEPTDAKLTMLASR